MSTAIVGAFVLGLIGGVIPGPVLAATFTEILQSGFLKGLRIVFWGVFSETVIALTILTLFSSIGPSESLMQGISIVGAGVLTWIAITVWRIRSIDTENKITFKPGKIFLMILANGELWIFWITICVPKALALQEKIAHGELLFLLFVDIGWLISTIITVFVFSRFRTALINPKVMPIAFKVFALVFAYFAIDMAYGSLAFFF